MSEPIDLSAAITGGAEDNPQALQVLLAAGAAIGNIKRPEGMAPYAIVPEGYEVEYMEVRDYPLRPVAKVKLRDAASFAAWFNDHKVRRSRIYALLQPAQFLAVIDDFDTSADVASQGLSGQADWREFRALFEVPASVEWRTWSGSNKKAMSQVEFAQFLLDNLPDVLEPAGSVLYDLALRFEASTGGAFKSHVRLQDGSTQLHWVNETTQGNADARLPDVIKLRIPVFENGQAVDIDARLRFRAKDAQLSIWYELVRPHKVLEAAFRDIWTYIGTQCQTTILLGSPE